MLPIRAKICKTVSFFQKSCVALLYMKLALKNSSDFKYHFSFLLEAKKRWGSSLLICKLHLKVHDIIKEAQ